MRKKKKIFLFVNGINTFPGDSRNWTGRAVTFVNTQTPHKAEKVEYFCGIIGRAFGQKNRVKKLYKTLSFYRDYDIVIAAHSNGAAVLLEMLQIYPDWPNLQEIHLICGACNADFEMSGLNTFLEAGRIKKCYVYIGGKDWVIKLANSWVAKLLGYKALGLFGAHNVSEKIKNKVIEIWEGDWENYGHSTAFNNDNFEKTMRSII